MYVVIFGFYWLVKLLVFNICINVIYLKFGIVVEWEIILMLVRYINIKNDNINERKVNI